MKTLCLHAFFLLIMIQSHYFVIGQQEIDSKRKTTKILLYDPIRGYLNWLQDWFVSSLKTKCEQGPCIVTERKEEFDSADIVIFHAPTHSVVPKKRRPSQMFVLISMEQPKYAVVLSNIKYINEKFDLLLTYSLQSKYPSTKVPNLPITYFPLNLLDVNSILQLQRNYSDKTDVAVAVFASNCQAAGASARFKYLEELMKHISVHSYGKCLNNRQEPSLPDDPSWPPQAQRRARKIKVLSHYKFYLAFENLQVEDYVSEKVFEGLFAGSVPVYRGAPSISRFMPSNDSFIDANSLSPRDLALKLQSLSTPQAQAQYESYFAFKQRPLSPEFKEMALRSYTHPNVLCRLTHYYYHSHLPSLP